MKKFQLFSVVLILMFLIIACDSSDDPVTPPEEDKGTLSITSTPEGASIILNGETQDDVTPYIYAYIDAGEYTITLSFAGYQDTTYSETVIKDETTTSEVILNPIYTTFGPVKIWETVGSDATQPSGLDLSSGSALTVGDDNNKPSIDLYYSSQANALVKSSHLHSSPLMVRETYFKVGDSSTLLDGVDSQVKDATWEDTMNPTIPKYFFINDNDNYYYKLIVTNSGGGASGPGWVEVTYIFNTVQGNTMF